MLKTANKVKGILVFDLQKPSFCPLSSNTPSLRSKSSYLVLNLPTGRNALCPENNFK